MFDDLSRTEARALLDAYVAGLPNRVDAFLDEVRRAGGPVDRLDFSGASMRPAWTWFLAAHRLPAVPATDEAMRSSDPPWWYDFHPPLGQELGPDLARLVTNLAAYLAKAVSGVYPDAIWVLGRNKRMANYNMPLLHIPGRGESTIDNNLISMAIKGLKGEALQADPGRLEQLYLWWVGESASPITSTAPPYSIGALEGRPNADFTHQILFDDVVAHEQEDRVAALLDRLAHEPGIERAAQEDREIVLVKASGLTLPEVEATVARAWGASVPPVNG